MAHKPLIFVAPLMMASVLAPACSDDEPFVGRWDLPTAAAVLQHGDHSPFEEPIGYVASGHTGLISMLALKQGRFLADDGQISFLRGAPIATGRARYIDGLAVWAPDPGTVSVIGTDRVYQQMFRVPHVVGIDDRGVPLEYRVTASDPVFTDADNSGDSPTLEDLRVKDGYTATEDWVVEYDGTEWLVTGSRSGLLEFGAIPELEYIGEDRSVAFTIRGEATAGDTFEFSTDNGLVEFDLGGIPLSLTMAPDQSRLAVTVHMQETNTVELRWIDPVAGNDLGTVPLPKDAIPGRMAWSEDGSVLYVADEGRSAAWEIRTDEGDALVEHVLPWPVFDVAPLEDAEAGTRWLYVAPLSGRSVHMIDLATDEEMDINPSAPGTQGMEFTAPVLGLEAIPMAYDFPETDNEGINRRGRSVAVSLYSGRIMFMEEHSGCLVQDLTGPRTAVQSSASSYDHNTSFDNIAGAAYLEQNATNLHHVQVNACAGVAPAEQWRMRFNAAVQAWEVEGVYSGSQTAMAYEDQRYTSDRGEISFVIRAGGTPSQDGWEITFETVEGAVAGDGNNGTSDTDDRDVVFDMPSDPVYFDYRVGPTDGGWRVIDERPFVLSFSQAADLVGRIEPQTGDIEVDWE